MLFLKLLELLTGEDNQTISPTYVWSAASVMTAIGLTIYSVVHGGEKFDIQSFGIGIGALMTGMGISNHLEK